MSEDEEKRRVEKGWILLVELELAFEVMGRIIISVDFVHPERFLIEAVESQPKTDDEAEDQNDQFLSPHSIFHQILEFHVFQLIFLEPCALHPPIGPVCRRGSSKEQKGWQPNYSTGMVGKQVNFWLIWIQVNTLWVLDTDFILGGSHSA